MLGDINVFSRAVLYIVARFIRQYRNAVVAVVLLVGTYLDVVIMPSTSP